MNKRIFSLMGALIFGFNSLFSQSDFVFKKSGDTKDKLRFKFVRNLTIIPITINGVELSFLLDTGVEKTILFSLEKGDSMELEDAVSTKLRGLGQGKGLIAFKSENNRVEIGDAISTNLSMYVIFNNEMNLSQLLGTPVHGIIGYDFFKNFIVEVNYTREFIKFYDPLAYDHKNRNYETKPLYFYHQKPYIKTKAVISGEPVDLLMLIDSGASDALWLFSDEEIDVPKNYFEDFLGLGLSGPIYGKRSKITSFMMGENEFEAIATAFPDSLALVHFRDHGIKNGLIGSEILKRFDLVIDYPNKQILFNPNQFFDEPFYYDMSGLVVQYKGVQVVKDFDYVTVGKFSKGTELTSDNNFQRKLYKVKFSIKPQIKIVEVRPGSPADGAGFQKGDVLVRINGKKAHDITLVELSQLFSSKEGKRIKMKVDREGKEITGVFFLEKML